MGKIFPICMINLKVICNISDIFLKLYIHLLCKYPSQNNNLLEYKLKFKLCDNASLNLTVQFQSPVDTLFVQYIPWENVSSSSSSFSYSFLPEIPVVVMAVWWLLCFLSSFYLFPLSLHFCQHFYWLLQTMFFWNLYQSIWKEKSCNYCLS